MLKLGLWLRLGCRGTSRSRKGLKGTVGGRSGDRSRIRSISKSSRSRLRGSERERGEIEVDVEVEVERGYEN